MGVKLYSLMKVDSFTERILPSQETYAAPTLPPLFYSSPNDDVIDREEKRSPEQYNQNERNAYDLLIPGTIEKGKASV